MHLTIGELARQAGVGVETIRFYQRKGLVERPARPASGFRVYTPEARSRIAFVREAQALGFTLEEIRNLLALRDDPAMDSAAVRGRAAAKLAQLDAGMARLERMRATLRALLVECPGRGDLAACSIIGALSNPARKSHASRRLSPAKRRSVMKAAELTIEGMHCDGCAKTIEALLQAESGVKTATASFAKGAARVLFDPAAADLAELVKAIERAGYRVTASR